MSIGATLAKARLDAGLTVTQVSERTRIRETIIRGIEQDDYSACGGDFYARGHVRSIARVLQGLFAPTPDRPPRVRRDAHRDPEQVGALASDADARELSRCGDEYLLRSVIDAR